MRVTATLGAALALATLGRVAGAAPVVSTCKGALTPSVSGGCEGVTQTGCCDVFGRALWCSAGNLYCVDCSDGFEFCGWNPLGYYDCGQAEASADPSGSHPLACGACPAECGGGAPCSPGCPGLCGSCGPGDVCLEAGECYTPACGAQECGEDPLGFSCGSCPSGTSCTPGVFQCLTVPDGCVPHDAPGCAGCGCQKCVCEKYPTCCTDHWDVFCATACEVECGQDCGACPASPSCEGVACGPYCGLECGGCPGGGSCVANQCCTPECDGKQCGNDACGGSCGTCPAGEYCADGACQVSICGGSCGTTDPKSCGGDCTCYCDEVCFQYGDCCAGLCGTCSETFPALCCEPECEGKSCGGDGCGGSCGTCPAEKTCEAGVCKGCEPACSGKSCGGDGCGGSCGSCAAPLECQGGACLPCQPKCDGRTCGDDGCGGSCGTCVGDAACVGGLCVGLAPGCEGLGAAGCCTASGALRWCSSGVGQEEACGAAGCGWAAAAGRYACGQTGADPSGANPRGCPGDCAPSCQGDDPAGPPKLCGSDGCGGSCGSCPSGSWCEAGQCLGCAASCAGRACGVDCAGTSCGSCGPGLSCSQAGTCEAASGCGTLTALGVCLGSILRWCAEGRVRAYDCADLGKECGFTPTLGYDCIAPGSCTPSCAGRQCGGDGCGGSCGACGAGTACNATGQCQTAPIAPPGGGSRRGCRSGGGGWVAAALVLLLAGIWIARRRVENQTTD